MKLQKNNTDMKTIFFGLLATILASFAQMYFIGLNGLTMVSIPLTIFLGIHAVEKLTEGKQTTK